ncbi:MAG TPA: NAD(P)-dependent oxidoreductase [Longimicrobiales bacterium]
MFGATGFIGRRVVAVLDRAGARVVAAGRDAAALDALRSRLSPDAQTAFCNAANGDDVARLIRDVHPAVTFNLAGYGVDRSERDEGVAQSINAELPARIARLLVDERDPDWTGRSLVHVGSALEYGEARGDLNEQTVPVATTLYGRSKLAGTEAVSDLSRRTGLPAVTARLFTVYGPGEHAGRLLPSLLRTAREKTPLELTAGDQMRDFTFVDDVAEGLLRLGLATASDAVVVNLATGRLETVRSFVVRAASVLGIDAALLKFGALPSRVEEMAHDPVAVGRLRELTGWVPGTGIEEGVLRTSRELEQSGDSAVARTD